MRPPFSLQPQNCRLLAGLARGSTVPVGQSMRTLPNGTLSAEFLGRNVCFLNEAANRAGSLGAAAGASLTEEATCGFFCTLASWTPSWLSTAGGMLSTGMSYYTYFQIAQQAYRGTMWAARHVAPSTFDPIGRQKALPPTLWFTRNFLLDKQTLPEGERYPTTEDLRQFRYHFYHSWPVVDKFSLEDLHSLALSNSEPLFSCLRSPRSLRSFSPGIVDALITPEVDDKQTSFHSLFFSELVAKKTRASGEENFYEAISSEDTILLEKEKIFIPCAFADTLWILALVEPQEKKITLLMPKLSKADLQRKAKEDANEGMRNVAEDEDLCCALANSLLQQYFVALSSKKRIESEEGAELEVVAAEEEAKWKANTQTLSASLKEPDHSGLLLVELKKHLAQGKEGDTFVFNEQTACFRRFRLAESLIRLRTSSSEAPSPSIEEIAETPSAAPSSRRQHERARKKSSTQEGVSKDWSRVLRTRRK